MDKTIWWILQFNCVFEDECRDDRRWLRADDDLVVPFAVKGRRSRPFTGYAWSGRSFWAALATGILLQRTT